MLQPELVKASDLARKKWLRRTRVWAAGVGQENGLLFSYQPIPDALGLGRGQGFSRSNCRLKGDGQPVTVESPLVCLVLIHTALEWLLEETTVCPVSRERRREESCQVTKEPVEDQERFEGDYGLGIAITQPMSG